MSSSDLFKIEYDNDVSIGDAFTEWWDVCNSVYSFRCNDEESANWLIAILNKEEFIECKAQGDK